MREACSLAKRREKSDTAEFSFILEGVVACLVLARRPMEDVYRMLRLRPNGPDSSGWRAFLAELFDKVSYSGRDDSHECAHSAYLYPQGSVSPFSVRALSSGSTEWISILAAS